MASALLRTSARRGSAFRRVVSAAAAPAAAPSGGEGLAVSLPPRPLHRLLSSGALGDPPPNSLEEKVRLLLISGDQPPKSANEKVISLLEEILATRSLSQDAVVDIFASALHARQEAYQRELSRSFMTSAVLVVGGLVGYFIR